MNIAVETPLHTPTAQLAAWVESLNERLAQRDLDATLELFASECHWRDLLLFSWNLLTLEGKPAIREMLETRLDQTRPDIGMPVVKVVVPGLRHFWARYAPGRLFDVPVRQGWLDRALAEHELNPVPVFV